MTEGGNEWQPIQRGLPEAPAIRARIQRYDKGLPFVSRPGPD